MNHLRFHNVHNVYRRIATIETECCTTKGTVSIFSLARQEHHYSRSHPIVLFYPAQFVPLYQWLSACHFWVRFFFSIFIVTVLMRSKLFPRINVNCFKFNRYYHKNSILFQLELVNWLLDCPLNLLKTCRALSKSVEYKWTKKKYRCRKFGEKKTRSLLFSDNVNLMTVSDCDLIFFSLGRRKCIHCLRPSSIVFAVREESGEI